MWASAEDREANSTSLYLVGERFALEAGELLLHERVAEERRQVVLLSKEKDFWVFLSPNPSSAEEQRGSVRRSPGWC